MGRGMHARSDERRAAAFDLPHKRPGRKRAAVVAACLAAMLCCGGALAWFKLEGKFDAIVLVDGGGTTGQAGAIRLALPAL